MSAAPIVGKPDKAQRKNAFRPVTLWLVVSGLWTAATVLRLYTAWVPFESWRFAVEGQWIWISLIIPPVMFAVILAAIHLIKIARK